jgi:hypothetical protein
MTIDILRILYGVRTQRAELFTDTAGELHVQQTLSRYITRAQKLKGYVQLIHKCIQYFSRKF